jgi:hypothetical protein
MELTKNRAAKIKRVVERAKSSIPRGLKSSDAAGRNRRATPPRRSGA